MSGLTNYNVDKPTYAHSGETTQFEDSLMRHGVITKEQALLNKGMDSESVAKVLAHDVVEEYEKIHGGEDSRIDYHHQNNKIDIHKRASDSEDSSDYDDDSEDDSNFMEQYRNARLGQLKETKAKNKFGNFEFIDRTDWEREVNEGSLNGQWVVVVLCSNAVEEAVICEREFVLVAAKFRATKFLKIRSTSAIENWPDENLPAVFCYRDGEMQIQLIGNSALGGPGTNAGRLEFRLAKKGIIEGSELTCDVEKDEKFHVEVSNLKDEDEIRGMSQLRTFDLKDDEDVYYE